MIISVSIISNRDHESRSCSLRNTERRLYLYAQDLVMESSVLFVIKITQINKCNLIGEKKVNVDINVYY